MCGYFRIAFIKNMLKAKSLLEYTHLVSFNEYENKQDRKKKISWL